MKATRYFLTIICMVSVLSVSAQPFVDQPQATFQSTSAMPSSGSSYASQPMLNSDGMATYTEQSAGSTYSSGPRKIVTPGNSGTQQPLGDALIPLLLCAFIYAFVALRRHLKSTQA